MLRAATILEEYCEQYLKKEYPDPQILAVQIPGKYVSTTARIVFLKTIQR